MRHFLILVCAMCVLILAPRLAGDERPQDAAQPQQAPQAEGEKSGDDSKTENKDLKPLELELPKPTFKGTPTQAPPGTNLEPARKGPRPPLMVPPGTKSVARNAPVMSSDMEPIIGSLKLVTDGEKEAREGNHVELGPGVQWVQLDLKRPTAIHGLLFWHYFANARIYHDVVVQVADDKDFIKNVRTLFNNDHDNSAGLGVGQDKEYWETYEGKLIDAPGVVARYVRLYSNGSTADDQNHYIEVEVFGKPPK